MQSVNTSPNPPTQCINGLTKTQLQELREGIIRHISDYDFLIQRQWGQDNKNYKIILQLCERRLELLATGLDCKSGFWQIGLSNDSKSLTTFSCPQGHYEWNVVPFGLKQAPGIFQRYMDIILEPFRDYCLVYVDDILIFSNTENEHYEQVKTILLTCKQKGIVLLERKAKQCLQEISSVVGIFLSQ